MRGKKQNVRLWAVAFWLIVWQLAAMALHAAYPHGALLLPSPVSSLARLISLAGTAVFWCAIGTSSMHILGGFLLSCALAVVLAALSARFSRVKELLAPLVAAVKTVPVASFIILALIWLSSRTLPLFIAAMPLFHGFGLGVCVHTMLSQGGRCILIPRFTAKSYAKQIVKYKCNFIAGVPTLYEALLRLPSMDGANLSSLKGVFSGGDSLSIELKKKFDKFLYDHKASIQVREGYGTTETVTACCLTPPHMFKEGSIGLPFPDTYIKIVEPDTDREVPYGQEGEILLAGPTVMKEYMNNPEETAQTLRTHADGLTWVYTGDLGVMDEQGFIYFRGRAKRMIISSGYNVYPSQIENILDAHEYVQMSCVIGVPDPYKMQKVKAFVKLAQGVPATEETKQVLMAYCRKNVAKYAMPYDIEFKEDMPKTLVGKVAYRQLEEEELAKIKAAEEK